MTHEPLRLLAVLAHPDDESLGFGGAFAKYADQGIDTYLITATRGEYGWFGAEDDYPGETMLGKMREAELNQAATILGIREVIMLDYIDGQLDQAKPSEAINTIAHHIRHIKPHVVITFDPYGSYGHPDHIAICQFTTAAIMQAATQTADDDCAPHQVQKLYYRVDTPAELSAYENIFGELSMTVDGYKRQSSGWEDWAITARLETSSYWDAIWRAVRCHQTQIMNIASLAHVDGDKPIWESEGYYRVFSMVNGGRNPENNLFEGLSYLFI